MYKIILLLVVATSAFGSLLTSGQGSYRVPQRPVYPQHEQRRHEPARHRHSHSPGRTNHKHSPVNNYVEEPRPYHFDYGVKDEYYGTNFGHSEKSDGKQVQGSYTVVLPDGRIQTVTYTADHHNGFQAKVSYEGEAQYPQFDPRPQHHQSNSGQRGYSPHSVPNHKVFDPTPSYGRGF